MPNVAMLQSVLANAFSRVPAIQSDQSDQAEPLRELILEGNVNVHPTNEINLGVVDAGWLHLFSREIDAAAIGIAIGGLLGHNPFVGPPTPAP